MYGKYMDAAQLFGREVATKSQDCTDRQPAVRFNTPEGERLIQSCHAAAEHDSAESRAAYLKAYTDVYIFGSDAGVDAALEVAKSFPNVAHAGQRQELQADINATHLFAKRFAEFQRIACLEMPAVPRSRC